MRAAVTQVIFLIPLKRVRYYCLTLPVISAILASLSVSFNVAFPEELAYNH
jgi:hypothetical protein